MIARGLFGHGYTVSTSGAAELATDILLPCRGSLKPVRVGHGRVRVANVANVLTGFRLVLVPVFLCALFAGDGHEIAGRIAAFVIFAVACITDRFDGALARNYGMVTEFGTLADPIADKALIGAALIGLSMLGTCRGG